MDVHLGNPAGRLFLFLDWTVHYREPQSSLRHAWSEYLGVDEGNTSAYLSRMVSVLRLTDEIDEAVGRLVRPVVPSTLLLRPVAPVRENVAASVMGSNPVSWGVSVFDAGVRNDLEMCSHVLAGASLLRPLDDDQLATIRSLVEDVIAIASEDGGLDAEAREAVLRYAHDLLRALDLHRVQGSQALVDELDRFSAASTRLSAKPTPQLVQKLRATAGAIIMGVGLFTGVADVSNALGTYGEMLTLPAVTEAPALGLNQAELS